MTFPWRGVIEVRDDGSVWRIQRAGRVCVPKRIDLPDRSRGYRNVVLPLDGRWRTFKAHRLVWWWHNGAIPEGLQINHRNLNKSDNRLANLELVTPSRNILHSYENGRTHPWARATTWRGKPRLDDRDRALARSMRADGSVLREIGDALGCSITSVQRLVRGEEVGNE